MQIIVRRIIQIRVLWAVVAILLTTLPVLGQEAKTAWTVAKGPNGSTEISARSEITAPEAAGFATFKIAYQPGVNPPEIICLIVESPKRLPKFPFERYDGPVEMTRNENMRLELASRNAGATRTIQSFPNGYLDSSEAFVFETIEKRVVRFLLAVKDGQKLSVIVNGPPSSIRVSFDTTGLKKLLDQVGLKHR